MSLNLECVDKKTARKGEENSHFHSIETPISTALKPRVLVETQRLRRYLLKLGKLVLVLKPLLQLKATVAAYHFHVLGGSDDIKSSML